MALTESDTHSFPLQCCKPTQLINWLVTLNVLNRPLVQYHLQYDNQLWKRKSTWCTTMWNRWPGKTALEITPSNIETQHKNTGQMNTEESHGLHGCVHLFIYSAWWWGKAEITVQVTSCNAVPHCCFKYVSHRQRCFFSCLCIPQIPLPHGVPVSNRNHWFRSDGGKKPQSQVSTAVTVVKEVEEK